MLFCLDLTRVALQDFSDTDQHFLFVATAGMALSALLFLYATAPFLHYVFVTIGSGTTR
jgi:hypothetical protein